jgi:hypothetical protein
MKKRVYQVFIRLRMKCSLLVTAMMVMVVVVVKRRYHIRCYCRLAFDDNSDYYGRCRAINK